MGSEGLSARIVETPDGLEAGAADTTGYESGEIEVTFSYDSDPAALATAYESAGRSPVQDAIAAGVNPGLVAKMQARTDAYQQGTQGGIGTAQVNDGKIYSSFCVSDSDGNVEMDGCVIRAYDPSDADPNYQYRVDETQGTGKETHDLPWMGLLVAGVKNSYNSSYVTILKISPGSDITDVSECRSQGFGVDIAGFGASISDTVCPDWWDMSKAFSPSIPRYHKVEWKGDSHNDRSADALTLFKISNGKVSNYTLTINWRLG